MNYAQIKPCDVANGPGVRVSLFVSGCTHHCEGCFNEIAWDFQYGEQFTEQTIEKILTDLSPDYISGLSLLGGEPMERVNQRGILLLLRKVKELYPQKTVWLYSGYNFETDIMGNMYEAWPETKELIGYLDVIVDGKFVQELKNLNIRFRGSSNQRIIKVPETLRQGEIILWE